MQFLFSRLKLFLLIPLLGIISAFIAADTPKKPDESRFTPVVLAQDLDEPMVFEVLKDGRVIIAERKGGLKIYLPQTNEVKQIANIPVNTKYTGADGVVKEAEEGLMGMTVHPDFDKNHWIYLYYAHPKDEAHLLTRWELIDNKLVSGTEKVVLTVATQREVCCHTGGGMVWDKQGNLFLTVGNNTGNTLSAQTDERPNRKNWDDQGHAGSTNDLRGKILRIHPENNGSYSIPTGNLFPKGTLKTRPEIYTMGNRNPWRVSIDSKTGYVYWGEVGSDATFTTEIGPRGYDELNQARKPGNFGWPYFVGPNDAFPYFDYAANKMLGKKDPSNPTNNSVNNTGLTQLPPVAPNFIYYPYALTEEFPLVGSGGRSATGGPIYHRTDFAANAKRTFPAYYENKWLATDLARGWIMAISIDENGNYKEMERFLPSYRPIEPIDMKFGPDGDLYVLEYGSTWFAKSNNSQLVRIEYNAGNRKPVVAVAASKTGGTVPFKTVLSAAGSKDLDGDALKYTWKVAPKTGGTPKIYNTANPVVTFDKPGIYTATLTVTDPQGASNKKTLELIAGNELPEVNFALTGNKSFFFPGKPIAYDVQVKDKEDGSVTDGKISPAKVAVSIDYVQEGFDMAEITQSQRSVDASTQFAVAKSIIRNTDCMVCHQVNTKSVGPMFTAIAEKYKGDGGASERLVQKIRNGGAGVWGEVNMPAHPNMSVTEASTLVKYILNINTKTLSTLPLTGTYDTKLPTGDNGRGYYILRAAYTDKGGKVVPGQTSEHNIILRNPQVNATAAEILQKADIKVNHKTGASYVVPHVNGYLGLAKIDLTNISQIQLNATTAPVRDGFMGGTIEVRLDKPDGELLGNVTLQPQPTASANAPSEAQAAQDAGGAVKPPVVAPKSTGPPKVNIKDITGFHTLYFVFKNEKAASNDPLMTFSSVKFIGK